MSEIVKFVRMIEAFIEGPYGTKTMIGMGVFLGLLFIWNFPLLFTLLVLVLILPPLALAVATWIDKYLKDRKTP